MNAFLGEMFSLHGKVALVTGASRGIGLAIANALAAAEAQVWALARSPQAPEGLVEGTRYYSCDVRDDAQLRRVFRDIESTSERLDIVVNAAGISTSPTHGMDAELERFDITLSVNLRAAFTVCLLARPLMHASGGGSIVNITSINSQLAFPGNPGYVAAKGGLRMLTKSLALDYADSNIRVNAIAPGYIRTQMTKHSYDDPALRSKRLERMMIPRYGEPEDVAGTVIYLASNAARYVTGQDIFVDGGWSAKGL